NGIGMYFNATFVSGKELRALAEDDQASGDEMRAVLRDPELWKDAPINHPPVRKEEADFSLFFTEAFVNKALKTVYLEDLGNFRMDLDFGEQTKDYLARIAPDVDIHIQLASDIAPNIVFEPNQLRLQVSDYFLNI